MYSGQITGGQQERSTEDEAVLQELWTAFLENYEACKAGKMPLEDENKYRVLSSPGPSQYHAFIRFFGFFADQEKVIEKHWNDLSMYDLAYMNDDSHPALLSFVEEKTAASDYKLTVMACGMFWKHHIPTRKKLIALITKLHGQGVQFNLFTQAKISAPYMAGLKGNISRKSRFNLKERIAIHYVLAGQRYLMAELPHTESTVFRLNMFLDLDQVEYSAGNSKKDLLQFLDKLAK